MTTYRVTMLTKKGGPEVLENVELAMPEPGPGEIRVRVGATGVGSTDVTMRRGYYPFAPKIPFVPGYESVGRVDAVGAGVTGFSLGDRVAALLVHGGYATHVVRDARDWVKVPASLDATDDGTVVALILNYVTAYQAIHRVAKAQPGQTALVNAAAGGVGQALVELLRVHGVRVIAAASARSHEMLRAMGAEPIEGRTRPIDEGARAIAKDGVDCAFDGVGGEQLRQSLRATRRGGAVVWYGFMGTQNSIAAVARNYLDLSLAPLRGKRAEFYGITALYRKDPAPLREDLPKLFALLADKKLSPRIALRLPLDQAQEANVRVERGGIDGKIVLIAS